MSSKKRKAKVAVCVGLAVVLHLVLIVLPMLSAENDEDSADYAPVSLVKQQQPELPPPLREHVTRPRPAEPTKVAPEKQRRPVQPQEPPPREPNPIEQPAEPGGAESSENPQDLEPPPPASLTTPGPVPTIPAPTRAAGVMAYEDDEERLLVDTVVYAVRGAQLEAQERQDARASAAASAEGRGGPGRGMEEPAEWGILGRTGGLGTAPDLYCD